jgi:lipoprotein-anchoring transpeptidase ErfK/SrfK
MTARFVLWLLACLWLATADAQPPGPITPDQVNAPVAEPLKMGTKGAPVLRAQVLLDRAHFSPGEIDAVFGGNLRKAVLAYQQAHDIDQSGVIDAATWKLLDQDGEPILTAYTIQPEDVAGPFAPVPEDMMEKSTLPALGYASPQEALGEKFHVRPELLQALNPDKDLGRAGEEITVLNVQSAAPLPKAAKVFVNKSASSVTLADAEGRTIAHFPATLGSEHDPLPLGERKIQGVSRNPKFHYNPNLFWDADAKDEKAWLQPGPNNPVGVVWVDLSKAHYGIHGTPEPRNIGKTESHGCIRLTNWDATTLADAVHPGMPAILRK